MAKVKAGKAKGKKAAARKAPRRQVKAAPAAAPQEAQAAAPKAMSFPCNALVTKGAEKIPVQVTDEAHYQRLVAEFGDGHVEVQS